MLSYAFLKAYKKGYITEEKYYNAGLKAFNGTVISKLTNNLKDIYLSSSVSDDSRDYLYCRKYVKDEAKGIAPLILIYSLLREDFN